MGTCNTAIKKVSFDFQDEQVTKVTVGIDFLGDCPVQLKRVYEKTFPARIPASDLIINEVPRYLEW